MPLVEALLWGPLSVRPARQPTDGRLPAARPARLRFALPWAGRLGGSPLAGAPARRPAGLPVGRPICARRLAGGPAEAGDAAAAVELVGWWAVGLAGCVGWWTRGLVSVGARSDQIGVIGGVAFGGSAAACRGDLAGGL